MKKNISHMGKVIMLHHLRELCRVFRAIKVTRLKIIQDWSSHSAFWILIHRVIKVLWLNRKMVAPPNHLVAPKNNQTFQKAVSLQQSKHHHLFSFLHYSRRSLLLWTWKTWKRTMIILMEIWRCAGHMEVKTQIPQVDLLINQTKNNEMTLKF